MEGLIGITAALYVQRLDCPYKDPYTSRVASTRTDRIEIRLKRRESRAWRSAAEKSKLTLSDWVRGTCNLHVELSSKKAKK